MRNENLGVDVVKQAPRSKSGKSSDEKIYSNVEPITEYIIPQKQSAKRHYGAHPYFTRRPWNVVQSYIKNFAPTKNATILDPFGGSGVTAIEALVLKKKGFQIDINPLANFLTKQIAVGPVNLIKLNDAYNRVTSLFESYFGKSPKKSIAMATDEFWYPKDVPLPKNADVKFVHELFTHTQLAHLAALKTFIMQERDKTVRDILLFTFSATLAKTNQTFISAKNRAESRGGSTIFSVYRYNVPSNPVVLDVLTQFQMRFKKIIQAKKETNDLIGLHYSEENFQAITGSATNFIGKTIESESIDYIFTDPPYGQHIAYLDLSAMWNAWLGFPVDLKSKNEEVIEGGDLKKPRKNYFDLLKSSLDQAYEALRYNRYLSIVYCHKDPAYWNEIYTLAQDIGFTYVSTQPQPLNVVWSMHKKKNALNVLAGELIVNFRKKDTKQARLSNALGTQPVKIIKNSAELTIVKNQGATTEQILFDLVPRLYENGLLSLVKNECADITPFLEEEFLLEKLSKKWLIKPNVKIGCFIPLSERIRFYVIDYLRRCQREGVEASFDQIVMNVIPNLVNGSVPTRESILDILKEIASTTEDKNWILSEEAISKKFNKLVDKDMQWAVSTTPPESTDHNVLLWKLLYLANKFGFSPYLGKNERKDKIFQNIPYVKDILKPADFPSIEFNKIGQIDSIWMSGKVAPIAAFEIEHSTTVLSALERFSALVQYCPHLRESRRLFLVFPKSRSRKVKKELLGSSYSKGSSPLTAGIRLIYENDLTKFYKKFHSLYGTIEDVESISFDVSKL